jgi:apolipoprotein N-acyltransferase
MPASQDFVQRQAVNVEIDKVCSGTITLPPVRDKYILQRKLSHGGQFLNKGSFIFRWREELLAGSLGGILLAMSFPPFPTRILAIIALVPILRYFLVVFPRLDWRAGALKRGFFTGFFFGLSFFTVLLFWITNLIPASAINMSWVMFPAFILLTLYLACFPALFALALAWFVKRFGPRAVFVAPAFWALTEFMRSSGEMALSWGLVSSALVPYPIAMQGLSLYGPFGFSMILVLVNVLITFVFFYRSNRGRVWSLTCLILLIGSHLWYGAARISNLDKTSDTARYSNVAIVQPNLDLEIKWKPEYRDSIFTEIENMAMKAAASRPDVVIFPETAAPVSISHSTRYRTWLKKIAANTHTNLFIGYINHVQDGGKWRSFNACGLIDSLGVLRSQYHKINLLPFGERIPFSQFFPFLEKMDFGQANFKPGQQQTVFDTTGGKFGALICFESTFSDFARRYVQHGAEFLVNITNDGWFGSSRGPLQHSETAVLRAIENGVTMIRSANTGVSMAIDPVGRIKGSIGLDKQGILQVPVRLIEKLTFYCKYGQLSFFVMFFMNLLVFLAPAFFSKHGSFK